MNNYIRTTDYENESKNKKLINLVNKFSPEDIIINTSILIRYIECKKIHPIYKVEKFLLVILYLILRFAIRYAGENPTKYFFENKSDYINVYNAANVVFSNINPPENEKCILSRFMMSILYQQRWYQNNVSKSLISRIIYFCKGDKESHILTEIIEKYSDIKINDFLFLVYFLCIWTNNNQSLDKHFISEVTKIDPSNVDKFFKLISLTIPEAHDYLKKDYKIKNPIFHVIEQFPMYQYPLLKIDNDTYLSYSKSIFGEYLRMFLYNISQKAGQEKHLTFTRIFENYIGRFLSEFEYKYLDEKKIDKCISKNIKRPDYILTIGEGTSLIIESKCIILKKLTRVNPTNRQLISELKDSVIKGLKQAYSFINAYFKGNNYSKEKVFLFIVTYENLYLGSGKNHYNILAKFMDEKIKKYISNNNLDEKYLLNLLPLENIFFISIDEFEILAPYMKSIKFNFCDFLNKAAINEQKSKTSKYIITEHLPKTKHESSIDFIDNLFNDFTAEVECKIKK